MRPCGGLQGSAPPELGPLPGKAAYVRPVRRSWRTTSSFLGTQNTNTENNCLGVLILLHVVAENVLLFCDVEVGSSARFCRFMTRYLRKNIAFGTMQHIILHTFVLHAPMV